MATTATTTATATMAAVRDAVREALRGMAVEELVQQSVADVRARLETEMGEDAVREALGENESVLEEWIVEYADEAMGSAGDPDATPTEAGDGDVASADAVPEEEPAPQADADADGDEDADADEDEKDDDDGVGSLSAESEDGELGNAVLRSNVRSKSSSAGGAAAGGSGPGSGNVRKRPVFLSTELQAVIGPEPRSRGDVVKALWAYFREHNLQKPSDKRVILCDDKLKALFRQKSINCFKMNQPLQRHMFANKDDADAFNNREQGATPAAAAGDDDEEEEEEEDGAKAKSGSAKSPAKKTAAKTSPQKKKKKAAKTSSTTKASSPARGLQAEVYLSDDLAAVVGGDRMPRTQVIKLLWAYIREHQLQDPKDKSKIMLSDAKLAKVFGDGGRTRVHMFGMNKLLQRHMKNVADVDPDEAEEDEDEEEEEEEADDDESEEEEEKKKPAPRETKKRAAAAAASSSSSSSASTKAKKQKAAAGAAVKKSGGSGQGPQAERDLSPALAELMGVPRASRFQAVKKVWEHIKAKGLQNPNDKREIICDELLKRVFHVDRMTMFQLNKLIGANFSSSSGEAGQQGN